MFIRIGGVQHYLWRAVDQHGVVLDILVREKRDGAAAKRFVRRLLKGLHYRPKRLIALSAGHYRRARTKAFRVYFGRTMPGSPRTARMDAGRS